MGSVVIPKGIYYKGEMVDVHVATPYGVTPALEIPVLCDTTRADALAMYRKTAADRWVSNPDLIEKYYFFDEETHLGGGVYIWPTREAAQRWHGKDYVAMVEATYGAPPRFQILDAVIRVVPARGEITEL